MTCWEKRVHESADQWYVLSDLQVLRSAAGYYLGREALVFYTDDADDSAGYPEPYDRETGYYRSREEAERVLRTLPSDREWKDSEYWPEGHRPKLRDLRQLMAEQKAELEAGCFDAPQP